MPALIPLPGWVRSHTFRARLPVFLIGLTLIVRVAFCVSPPSDTSDLYRHLGFTSHWWENPADFYHRVPTDFGEEFWTRFWGEMGYIYPPLALLFFAPLGSLGVGLVWVKMILTIFDLLSACLIGRTLSWWAGLLLFSAPVSVWYTSHEGQYESLVTLLLVLSILSARRGRWIVCGSFFQLALQTKQLALFAAPYFLWEIFQRTSDLRRKAFTRFAAGWFVTLLPFLPFYHWRHDLWLLPLVNQGNVLNSYYWPAFWTFTGMEHFDGVSRLRISWNEAVSLISLVVLLAFVVRGSLMRRLPQDLPSIGFWSAIKSMSWVMNWYVLLLPGLNLCLWRHRRWFLLLCVLYWFQCGQEVAGFFGDDDPEAGSSQIRFRECLWHADYRMKASPEQAP